MTSKRKLEPRFFKETGVLTQTRNEGTTPHSPLPTPRSPFSSRGSDSIYGG
ncbi:hypothetical protein [Scytonema hofmannii]|uniref:hypothetical protein n=1 Tax=Scytonema hofmannii TaxID=34078 RepID=UPI00034A7F76|nr:hypothetical protein [Scytonema hofmannii]